MDCPNCGSELTKGKKAWLCEDCGYKQPIAQTVELSVDDLFYSDAFDSYYPLLAHEYHVLYGFMKEQNYFGALLEYKDVVEIVLKFPTLVAINHLWRKNEYELPEEKQILELLLGKPLSLGDWQAVCGHFIKLYKGTAPEYTGIAITLKPLLEAVNKFYEQGVIVHWRNETIGHGALQSNLENNSEFINDFSARLKALKAHLANNRRLYDQLEVLDTSNNPLRGKDCEEHIGDMLRIRLGTAEYDQTPFVLVKDRTTNIFDSCVKDSVYILNYITGKKIKQRYGLADVFAEKRKAYFSNERLTELEQSASKLMDSAFDSEEINIISKMADEKEAFTNPEYIIGDIKSFFAGNDKGVLFLQMERGMGKTTLVRAIDQLAMGNVRLDDGQNNMAVRAYYINNMFSYRIDHFQNESVFILTNAENFGVKRFVLSGISSNFIDAEDMSAEFARFLNDVLGVYQQKTPARKLLFIIDGLDEIRYGDKRTIFDCIPHSEKLADGVYLLLTGRHKNEVAPWIQEKYAAIEGKAVSTIGYHCTNEHNRSTLENYLARQLYKKSPAEMPPDETVIINAIIEKGSHRFLYVKALGELQKAGNFNINEISDESILERYLNVLERKYGKGKHYEKIKRLLLITALLDEPATIEELSYLYSFETADFKFLGYMTDLKGLLRIDRTGTGETVSASVGTIHEDWKRHLIDRDKIMMQGIVADWVDEVRGKAQSYKDGNTTVLDNISDGESYLVANIYTWAQAYTPALLSFFNEKETIVFLSKFAECAIKEKSIKHIKSAEQIYTSIISAIEAMPTQQKAINETDLSSAYMSRGLRRYDLLMLDNAIMDYGRCIEINEQLSNTGKLLDENALAKAFLERGLAYRMKTEYEKALSDYNRYFEIIERLRSENKLINENDLAIAYRRRSAPYYCMTDYDKSLMDDSRCIEIMERLYSEGKLSDENDLALAYYGRNATYHSMFRYDESLSDNNKCIEMMERLLVEGKLIDENDLALAYQSRGITYDSMTEYEKAMADYNKCIEVMEQLYNNGKLYNENDLASAYQSRGGTYDNMTEYEKTMADYNRCIKIRERLYSEGKLYNENDLAVTYISRGRVYDSMTEYKKAMADYSSCIEIRERLYNAGKLYDENDLADAYYFRGVTYDNMTEYDKSVTDYNKCIEINERLFNEGKLYDENNLAWAYYNRGVTYGSMTEYDKSITDYNKCIEIRERLYNAGKLYDENDLAWIYMNRGELYHSMTLYDKAIDDLNKSLEIRMRLQDEGKLSDKNNLAEAYLSRGITFHQISEYDKSMSDYNKCLEIREHLYNEGKLHDENYLALAYMHRGILYCSWNQFDKSLEDHNKCIEIKERMYSNGKLYDENRWALAYLKRGELYHSMSEYDKAVADYDRCIQIRERLQAASKLYNKNDLTEAYENKKATLDAMQG